MSITQQICWIHFKAFIAETYVQLAATEVHATLLIDPYCTVRWLKMVNLCRRY